MCLCGQMHDATTGDIVTHRNIQTILYAALFHPYTQTGGLARSFLVYVAPLKYYIRIYVNIFRLYKSVMYGGFGAQSIGAPTGAPIGAPVGAPIGALICTY